MLHINNLTYRIAGRLLFDKATVAVAPKAKAGLVGRNGTGKSTLLAIIRGEASPEAGSVSVRKGARVGSVAQEAPGGQVSLLDIVLAADEERAALLAEAETAGDPHRIADIQTRLADIEAHSAEARAAAILAGLGFAQGDLARPCAEFSGGWRMRAALAAVLFARPDLLLLDEPTNYLDLEGAVWLEAHLRVYPGATLLISHDRDLLNSAVAQTIHLRDAKLFSYQGGYDQFERQLAEQQRLQIKLKDRQEAERKRLQGFVDRFRAKPNKARQAQSRVKRLEKMRPVATIVESPVAPFTFPAPQRRMAPPLINLEGAAVGYGGAPVLTNLDLRIDADSRIGLLGRNGAGKSTFAKLLDGRLTPSAGSVRRHKKLQVAYFAQHQIEDLDVNASAYEHVIERMPDATEAQRRARLGSFGLAQSKADTKAGDLSGGEKARLLLHLVTFAGPHILILDEPTNHLDMDSRAALVDALNDCESAVILISHDRHLIESCAEELWLADAGALTPYDGDMDDYRKLIAGRPQRAAIAPGGGASSTKAQRRRASAKARAARDPLKKDIERWRSEAARLQGVISVIDKGLAAPGLYESDPAAAADLSKKRANAAALLDAAELSWLEAEEAYEAARAADA